ncbi:hypothetical protein E2C01_019048 [Portunus trituberculatus]|uniref:Uncharacterized protein n=1 Tax=Portunus trituberculatus TaxID=210409 RepID=A0A5B7DYS0_PORTR|nr:hypothetical protein [Portunus trituberculatus]
MLGNKCVIFARPSSYLLTPVQGPPSLISTDPSHSRDKQSTRTQQQCHSVVHEDLKQHWGLLLMWKRFL